MRKLMSTQCCRLLLTLPSKNLPRNTKDTQPNRVDYNCSHFDVYLCFETNDDFALFISHFIPTLNIVNFRIELGSFGEQIKFTIMRKILAYTAAIAIN